MRVITRRRGRRTGATAAAWTRHLPWTGVGLVILAGCSSAAARYQQAGLALSAVNVAGSDTVRAGYDDYLRKLTTGAVGAMVVADDRRRTPVNRVEDLLAGRCQKVLIPGRRGDDARGEVNVAGRERLDVCGKSP